MRLSSAIAVVVAIVSSSTTKAQSCSVEYFGPDSGQTKVLQPGGSVGGYLMTQRGSSVSAVSSSTLEFQGRTGEKTFAFVSKNETKLYALGGAPRTDADTKPLSAYWEGLGTPMKVSGYTFLLAVKDGETSVTMLHHPAAGPCAAARSKADHDPQDLIAQLELDLPALQREGFDPSRPAIDGCAALPWDPKTVSCTGKSGAPSEQLCRAGAMAAIIGMAKVAREQSLSGEYTLQCANHKVVVHYNRVGQVQLEQTSLSSRLVVFSKTFAY